MKTAFVEGFPVRFNIADSVRAKIVRYLREGFYEIRTIPEGRSMVAHEDDLVPEDRYQSCPIHPYRKINNAIGDYCPECFESSERFIGNIMPKNGR